jgi:hypothetical protein
MDRLIDALPFLEWWFYGCALALVLMFFMLVPMSGARDDVAGCAGTIMMGAILELVLWIIFGGEGASKTSNSERESIPRDSTRTPAVLGVNS